MSETVEASEDPEAESIATAAGVQRRNRRIKINQRRLDDHAKRQMSSPIGRAWLWGLLIECGTFEDRFAASPAGQPDARATDFHAGQRSVGLRLMRTLARTDPSAFAAMLKENDR